MRPTVESGRLEILALEAQLMEQEKCHLEQISMMENERRLNARDREAERVQYEERIAELSNQYVNVIILISWDTPLTRKICIFSIKTMEENQDATTKDLIHSKTEFRRSERNWMAEKEFLMRKLQFVQTYGSVIPPSVDGGFYTDARSGLRKVGELKSHRDLQKLNVSFTQETTFKC